MRDLYHYFHSAKRPIPQPQGAEVKDYLEANPVDACAFPEAFTFLLAERDRLRRALAELRGIVHETPGAPRYYVTPGAALNSVIAETVDPALAATKD